MSEVTTEEIMKIALDLVGMKEIPQDSGIFLSGKHIKKILFSMDVNVGLLTMAKQLGFDVVVGHHPCGVLFHRGEVFRRHIDLLEMHGVAREKSLAAIGACIDNAVKRIENGRFRQLSYESPNQTILEVDAAKLLNMPFMNIHNLFDEQGRRILQAEIDSAAKANPGWILGDVLELIENLPEARYAKDFYGISPYIFLGDASSEAGKTVFIHGALSAPHPDIIRFYWQNGINTVVILHNDFNNLMMLKKEPHQGNLILTGHFLGDSLGFTPFIAALRGRGLEVSCTGGIIDTEAAGY